jgi:hypothetical protein
MEYQLTVMDPSLIIDLPGDMVFENEFDWSDIKGSNDRTLGGTLIIWTNTVFKGRPIDLVATDNRGWISRSTIEKLYTAVQAMSTMELKLTFTRRLKSTGEPETVTYNVMWRYNEPPVMEVRPLIASRVELVDGDYYTGTLKFVEV